MHLELLAESRNEIGDSGLPPKPPKDFDMEKFYRGRKFLQDHIVCHVLAMFISLVCGLSVVNLLEPLIFTQNSDTPRKAFKRYCSTFLHVSKWVYGDIWDKGSRAYNSVLTVRSLHNKVREEMTRSEGINTQEESGDMKAHRKDTGTCPMGHKGLRLSQYDMSLVQCGFLGMVVLYPRSLGIRCNEDDLDDFVYFWYGVGYMLGITDKNNICKKGFHATWKICKEIEQNVLLPSMQSPHPRFYPMAKALIDGSNKYNRNKMYSVESVTAVGFRQMNVKSPKLSIADYCRYLCYKIFFILLYFCPPVKRIFNALIRKVFWDSGATVNTFIKSY